VLTFCAVKSRRPHLEYHFDIVCPFAYLGSTQVEALCERTGATLSWHPFLLGGVLKTIGTDPTFTLKLSPAKTRHNLLDAIRWADHLGVPFKWHNRHPMLTVTTMRALTLFADDNNAIEDPTPIHALFRAYHVDGRDIVEEDVLGDVLTELGMDGPALVAQTKAPPVKQRLREISTRAADRGIFGAPAMFVNGELFWGQDRLHFVENALKQASQEKPS